MLHIITAPNEVYFEDKPWVPSIFLAGGITNCPDWQSELIEKFQAREAEVAHTILKDINSVVLYNPRRENFPIHDPNASEVQICWEYEHLKNADIIIFWFAKGSLNPIVLYELGRWGNSSKKPIIIGCDPEYARTSDVRIQTNLSRPGIRIHTDLNSLYTECVATLEKVYSQKFELL